MYLFIKLIKHFIWKQGKLPDGLTEVGSSQLPAASEESGDDEVKNVLISYIYEKITAHHVGTSLWSINSIEYSCFSFLLVCARSSNLTRLLKFLKVHVNTGLKH